MNYLEQTLAQLACDIPGATRVFHQHKLDFCCGGKVTLAEAIVGRRVSAERDHGRAGRCCATTPG